MLALNLKTIGIAGFAGFVLGGIAAGAAYERLIVPGRLADERVAVTKLVTESVTAEVTAERDALCLASTTTAADMARRAAEQRQADAVAAALAAYRKSAEESARVSASEIASLESEIRAYEKRLEELGRLCPLGPDDYRFIYGDGVQLPRSEDGQ